MNVKKRASKKEKPETNGFYLINHSSIRCRYWRSAHVRWVKSTKTNFVNFIGKVNGKGFSNWIFVSLFRSTKMSDHQQDAPVFVSIRINHVPFIYKCIASVCVCVRQADSTICSEKIGKSFVYCLICRYIDCGNGPQDTSVFAYLSETLPLPNLFTSNGIPSNLMASQHQNVSWFFPIKFMKNHKNQKQISKVKKIFRRCVCAGNK